MESLKLSAPTTKILLSTFTILYVVTGALRVSVDGENVAERVAAGQVVVVEKEEPSAGSVGTPTELNMIPLPLENGMADGTCYNMSKS
jgi:quercetin dioxygenase-like cupin family protein